MYRNDQSHEFANRESLVDQEAENERNVGCGEVGGGGTVEGALSVRQHAEKIFKKWMKTYPASQGGWGGFSKKKNKRVGKH